MTARDHNAIADLVDRFEFGADDRGEQLRPDGIRIANTTGSDLRAGEVVGLADHVAATKAIDDGRLIAAYEFPGFAAHQIYTAEEYLARTHWDRLAVVRDAAKANSIVRADADGPLAVELSVRNEHHTHARPRFLDPERWETAWDGAPILYREQLPGAKAATVKSGTAVTVKAWIRLPMVAGQIVRGYLLEPITAATIEPGPAGAEYHTPTATLATMRVFTDQRTNFNGTFPELSATATTADPTDSYSLTVTNFDHTLNVPKFSYIVAQSTGRDWFPIWVSCSAAEIEQ